MWKLNETICAEYFLFSLTQTLRIIRATEYLHYYYKYNDNLIIEFQSHLVTFNSTDKQSNRHTESHHSKLNNKVTHTFAYMCARTARHSLWKHLLVACDVRIWHTTYTTDPYHPTSEFNCSCQKCEHISVCTRACVHVLHFRI